jgi:hypothetical protein
MSAQLEMDRIRNTYYYSITSDDGEQNDDIGNFDIQIPPFPQQEHNSASRCIFTLQGLAVGDQVLGQQVGAVPFLSLEVNGLGLNANNYNSTNAIDVGGLPQLRQTNRFLIPNVYEEFESIGTNTANAVVVTTVPTQRLTGSFDLTNPYVLLCSNPVGKHISFRVFDDQGDQLPANVNLNTIVRFKIEIVPDSA